MQRQGTKYFYDRCCSGFLKSCCPAFKLILYTGRAFVFNDRARFYFAAKHDIDNFAAGSIEMAPHTELNGV
ncbi:hypothetical protein [Paenibacillus sp. J22TS3]|uniref:hypothetical protein n=1 Tax=Paenibacillus sp. J22TS3 TaxID=2807192 RepID=UPI001B012C3B|nr:hypothetical protein [Paenibacillus sp. J22TS3]GIP21876.1 hypothetical protein J22TS3_21510 [Paenibacillus sp. J22TS3]